jgi:hypothetical protein
MEEGMRPPDAGNQPAPPSIPVKVCLMGLHGARKSSRKQGLLHVSCHWNAHLLDETLCCAGCDMTVLLMSVATVWQTLVQISSGTGPDSTETDGYVDSFWGVVELSFTIFFTVEVLLKLICYGWKEYWSGITNRSAFSAFKRIFLLSDTALEHRHCQGGVESRAELKLQSEKRCAQRSQR